MKREDLKVGDRVMFGRPNGEKTIGKVIRCNAKSVSVESLEDRGRKSKAGGKWRVPYSLLAKVDDEAGSDLDVVKAEISAEEAEWLEERRAMARGAFGKGVDVMNVFTGERYTT